MPHSMKLKNIRWQIVALFTLFMLTAGMYSVFMPLDETPDEASHFRLVRFIAENQRFPATNDERVALGDKGDASPLYHALVAVLSQHVDVSLLPVRTHLDDAKIFIPYDTIPTTHKIHTDDEAFPFQGIVLAWHLARLVSVFLSAVTLFGIYLTTRVIFPGQPYLALATVGVIGFIPAFLLNSSAINDDNLVVPLMTFAIYYMVRIINGDTKMRSLILLGVMVGLASITKYHAVVLVFEFSLVFAWLAWRNKPQWRVYFRQWAIPFGVFSLILGGWFVLYLMRFTQVSELGLVKGVLLSLGDPTTADVSSFTLFSGTKSLGWAVPLFQSFWLIAGSLLVGLPNYVYLLLLGFVLLAGVGWFLPARKSVIGKAQPFIFVLLAFHLLLYIGIVYGRYQIFLASHDIAPIYSAQGRHIFPAVVSIAILLVVGWGSIVQMLPSVQKSVGQILAYVSTGAMFVFGVFSFWLFVYPIYQPYLPVATPDTGRYRPQQRVEKIIGDGMLLKGYDIRLPQKAENMLGITLYWQSDTDFSTDKSLRLCLQKGDVDVVCSISHPADGFFPTRAWQNDYEVRDDHFIPIPACLTAGDYDLTLGEVLSADDAPRLNLGRVSLPASPFEASATQICTGGECYQQGEINVSQMRQSVMVLNYDTDPTQFSDAVLRDDASQTKWVSAGGETIYQCSAQQFVKSTSFVVSPQQSPGKYTLHLDDENENTLSVKLKTRLRNFAARPTPQYSTQITFADQLDFLGYNVDLSPHFPNDPLQITSFWQSITPMNRNYNLAIHLLDHNQTTQAFVDYPLGGLYPNILWATGEYVSDAREIDTSAVSAGWHTLELRLYDRRSADFSGLEITNFDVDDGISPNPVLGKIRILDSAHEKEPSHSAFAKLGETIQLTGYDIDATQIQPGQSTSFALYWQSKNTPSTDYTVFTQLIGPDNAVWSQQDNQPQQGGYPTSTWDEGDKVVDRYQLTLPADAPTGDYRLFVGMYDFTTGERLPMFNIDGNQMPNNAIELTSIAVGF